MVSVISANIRQAVQKQPSLHKNLSYDSNSMENGADVTATTNSQSVYHQL